MITPSFSLTATERVLPKLALDFTTASLDPRVTFTRTTDATHPATYTNSSGLIVSATNNQPRFDYNPVTLACKGLLIEESRANAYGYSTDFANADWSTGASGITRINNQAISPDGTQNAAKIYADNGAIGYFSKAISVTSGTVYSISIYAKKGEYNWLQLAPASQLGSLYCNFNLATGVVGSGNTTGTMTDVGNGWYRCSISPTATGTSANGIVWIRSMSANLGRLATPDGDGSSGIYIWGAQFETGAFATSYIPTAGTALTRNADVATMTGTNFSSWFNATEGTFQCSFINEGIDKSHGAGVFSADNGSVNGYVIYRSVNNSTLTAYGGTNTTALGSITINAFQNSAYSYSATTNGKAALNAALPGTVITTGITTPTTLRIGNTLSGTNNFSGWIIKFNYWIQKVTTDEVQAFSK